MARALKGKCVERILTLPEVAEFLRVAEKTVYQLAQRGELPVFKVGGMWRFRATAVEPWIDRRTGAAAGKRPRGKQPT
jgi:excisionase family DNA binding protein